MMPQPALTYQQRRRPPRRRSRSWFYLAEALICIVLLGGFAYGIVHYVTRSPTFRVREIVVDGANVLREEHICAVARVTSDDNLMLSDVNAIQQRVQRLPYVRFCEVRRAPPHTLIIRIEERVPEAAVFTNGRLYEIDAEGFVLRELDPLADHVGPLITNVPGLGVPEPGRPLKADALTEALRVWRAVADTSLLEALTISEISAPDTRKISMFCDELPYEIRWGRGDYAMQAARFETLWENQGGDLPCREYLDLRFEGDLVCK